MACHAGIAYHRPCGALERCRGAAGTNAICSMISDSHNTSCAIEDDCYRSETSAMGLNAG
jgi:hypothetical protein